MNCSTDLNRSVYWTRTLVGYRVQQWLYYGKNGFNGNNADRRFSMDKDEAMGRYDIIISDVEPGDVGQYVCVDDSGIGVKASAELVLSGGPIRVRGGITKVYLQKRSESFSNIVGPTMLNCETCLILKLND